mmetsp:Transcript_132279/g.257757  ORF Transcript_132279/g.257757 Transcript_132279/m.257757 type:complete len:239 (+) Transcript_132279:91-807(+)
MSCEPQDIISNDLREGLVRFRGDNGVNGVKGRMTSVKQSTPFNTASRAPVEVRHVTRPQWQSIRSLPDEWCTTRQPSRERPDIERDASGTCFCASTRAACALGTSSRAVSTKSCASGWRGWPLSSFSNVSNSRKSAAAIKVDWWTLSTITVMANTPGKPFTLTNSNTAHSMVNGSHRENSVNHASGRKRSGETHCSPSRGSRSLRQELHSPWNAASPCSRSGRPGSHRPRIPLTISRN